MSRMEVFVTEGNVEIYLSRLHAQPCGRSE
jgi:hypothetical protein